MRIGLITCLELPEPDPDQAPLSAELVRRGHEPVLIPWDGSPAQFETRINVLRSTWNYYETPDAFLQWIDRAAALTPVINPPDVVRWNIHKKYLASLQDRGVPIVPTGWFTRGCAIDLADLVQRTGWQRVVIKPAISAASFRTRAFEFEELNAAQQFADQLVADRDVLVQKHLTGYGDPGERSLIWIGGEWTHAVRKRPRFAGEVERVEADVQPDQHELGVADAALAPIRHRLAYGRVDLVRDESGSPLVSEVELMEPSLFFAYAPHALQRFVDVIEARGQSPA